MTAVPACHLSTSARKDSDLLSRMNGHSKADTSKMARQSARLPSLRRMWSH